MNQPCFKILSQHYLLDEEYYFIPDITDEQINLIANYTHVKVCDYEIISYDIANRKLPKHLNFIYDFGYPLVYIFDINNTPLLDVTVTSLYDLIENYKILNREYNINQIIDNT